MFATIRSNAVNLRNKEISTYFGDISYEVTWAKPANIQENTKAKRIINAVFKNYEQSKVQI
ncbi:hypothetical protein FACS1894105_02060 [Clostridia bacterium]|nr:hypothetical protein FACS1894105_02060 [Clostridia bacterium]